MHGGRIVEQGPTAGRARRTPSTTTPASCSPPSPAPTTQSRRPHDHHHAHRPGPLGVAPHRAREEARRPRRPARHPAHGSHGAADELVTAVTACSTRRTGQPATDRLASSRSARSRKVWTATVVMQLVDEGLLDLDTPVVEVAARARGSPTPTSPRRVTDPAPAHPHQRHRRRRLHRHRPRRRLPGEVRRRCSATRRRTTRSAPPGPTATPASRCSAGSSRSSPALTWDQAMRERLFTPLGLDQHRARCRRRRMLLRRRRRPRRGGDGRAGAAPVVGPAPLGRPGRPDHRDGRPTCSPSPGCT